ncbi:glycosyltransferase [Paenibacillus lupini]|uniref:glycosyltransferase n=1 Tax=Paenibacillus lupini TaxID=1450204 RepID=UPI0014208D60|nr:glycosyltransferase [Paenibacillus lupini]NIK26288.1 glycosyltransferase involved in cell wall biosynthesis [Paenibacillus lupini]
MNYRIAIVHDYLNQMGGAERVVGVMHKLFPEAPIYTTIVDREKLLPELRDANVVTTWMQHIPNILRDFKLYFWLYPFAVRSMKLQEYDIIISSSSAYAKGIRKPGHAVHLCYCHSPMRFAWNFDGYIENVKVSRMRKIAAKWLTFPLRIWDKSNSKQVDRLIANSSVVKERINKFYGLESSVIYPPVEVERFSVSSEAPEDYFLIVSRLVSYKKIDIAIEACSRLGRKLLIVGDGDDRERLEAMAGPNVQFLGRRSDEEVVRYMQRCQALLFPGLEDFGITPLEANACGRPVIAFQAGGALDTIKSGLNGLFFKVQNAESLIEALQAFDRQQWDPQLIRDHAETFNERFFIERLLSSLQSAIDPLGSNLKHYGVEAGIHFGR